MRRLNLDDPTGGRFGYSPNIRPCGFGFPLSDARQNGERKAEREKCVNFRIQREEKVTLIVGSIGMISIAVRSLTWELIQFYRRTRVIIIIDFGFNDTLKSGSRRDMQCVRSVLRLHMRFNRIKTQCKKYISPAVYTRSLSYIYRLHCAASRRSRIIENNAAQTRNADIANKSRGSGEVKREINVGLRLTI